jgi:DNA-binding YbaB/EbfC family protein
MANPFGQMKDMYKMQREAKKMQQKMREKIITGESKNGDLKLFMNAAQEFEDIDIEDSLLDPARKDDFKKALKEAFKEYQKKLQKEMMKDFDMDSLKNMLGK